MGSANYSDENSANIESGTIITDKSAINKIYEDFFSVIIEESTPYFDDAFNVCRLFVLSTKTKFEKMERLAEGVENIALKDRGKENKGEL